MSRPCAGWTHASRPSWHHECPVHALFVPALQLLIAGWLSHGCQWQRAILSVQLFGVSFMVNAPWQAVTSYTWTFTNCVQFHRPILRPFPQPLIPQSFHFSPYNFSSSSHTNAIDRKSISSVTQSYLTLCDPMDYSTAGFPVHHQLPELTQTHVHWVGDAIQPSHPVVPFFSHLQSFPASGSFPMSQLFTSGGQSIGVSASASVLPMNYSS